MRVSYHILSFLGKALMNSARFLHNHANKKTNKINELGKVAGKIWHEFDNERCFSRAAALAYTTLFSLVPLLAVSFAIFAAFPVFSEVSNKVQQLIFDNFVTTSAQTIHDYLLSFIEQTAHLSIVGMIFLLITAVLLVFSMETVFNDIWKVKTRRHGVAAFLLYWAVITLIPIVVALLTVITTYAMSFTLLEVSVVKQGFFMILPYVVTFMAFLLLYYSLPNCRVPFSSAAIGGIIATALLEVAKYGFSVYTTNLANFKLIYGALAIIPIFLMWLYVVWLIILFGAVIGYVWAEKRQLIINN